MDPLFINKVNKVTIRTILLIYFQELVLLKVPTISLSRLVHNRLVYCYNIINHLEVYTKAVKLHISVSDVCITLVYYLQES